MANRRDERDEEGWSAETAMRQFRALRYDEQLNVLNERKVRRRAREAGMTELAEAVERRRYFELVERYLAECRSGSDE
jgi:hypothetical protein